jgi:hypothetical protein
MPKDKTQKGAEAKASAPQKTVFSVPSEEIPSQNGQVVHDIRATQ